MVERVIWCWRAIGQRQLGAGVNRRWRRLAIDHLNAIKYVIGVLGLMKKEAGPQVLHLDAGEEVQMLEIFQGEGGAKVRGDALE
jgi:hypothetical protein